MEDGLQIDKEVSKEVLSPLVEEWVIICVFWVRYYL